MVVEEEREGKPVLDNQFVKAKAYVRKPAGSVGVMLSPAVNWYYEAQAARLEEREIGKIPFKDISFELLTSDQVAATAATAIIISHDHIDTARALAYHRPDHELAAIDVLAAYYHLRTHGFLRTYLEASARIDPKMFNAQLDEVVKCRENEGPIEIPLVQHLTLVSLQRLDLQVFYANFAANMQEVELKKLLAGFAIDQENLVAFLLGRVKTELAEDPTRLPEVETGLLDFKPYGQAFDPDFETHRIAMLKVSPPGLVRADLVRRAVRQIVGAEHLSQLEQLKPPFF